MEQPAAADASPTPTSSSLLPALPQPPCKEQAGPTPCSNWVLPGRVLAGAFPASMDDAETDSILTALLQAGVNTFVCLQAEANMYVPTHAWRSGAALRPYIKDAQRLLSTAAAQESDGSGGGSGISQRKLDLLHLPIQDGSVTTDLAMSRLADDCCARVLRGEKLYIHCWGGHGRTGTLVAILLGRLYGLSCSAALRLTQAYHDARVFPQGVRSPQTPVQRAQVRRLLQPPPLQSVPTVLQPASTSLLEASCSRQPGDSSSSSRNVQPAMPAVPGAAVRAPLSAVTSGCSLLTRPVPASRCSTSARQLGGGAAAALTSDRLPRPSLRQQVRRPVVSGAPSRTGRVSATRSLLPGPQDA